jgi:hypothetical protein
LLTKREVSSEFNLPIQEHCFDRGTYSIWVKKVSFTESSFSRKLSRASISAIENQVRREIELCKFMSEEPYRCQYVYRGVLRNMNRIESSDASRFIAEAFRESPTFELDKARILKDRGWASEAFKLLNPVS